jgi:hypothetical protein
MIKKEIRVLGIASVTVRVGKSGSTHVVGIVYRGNRWLEGVMRVVIPWKQLNLTTGIAKMVIGSPHFPQLRVIVLDELVSKRGSYVDIEALSRKTGLPIVAVLQSKPRTWNLSKTRTGARRAIKMLTGLSGREWKAMGNTYFVYSAGIDEVNLDELLKVCASGKGTPEAARVARITASSLQNLLAEGAP